MPDLGKTRETAQRFVDLVLWYKNRLDELKGLPPEAQVFFDIVSDAGFDPKTIAPGKLVGHYRDQDGSSTGETYPINAFSPFKVIGADGHDDYRATNWLDCALGQVISNTKWHEKTPDEIVEVLVKEIQRSIPLEPIRLTREGDFLCEYPPPTHGFGRYGDTVHTRDGDALRDRAGVHAFCNGDMERRRVRERIDAIVCEGCYLRVLIPRSVQTYGVLREVLTDRLLAVEELA